MLSYTYKNKTIYPLIKVKNWWRNLLFNRSLRTATKVHKTPEHYIVYYSNGTSQHVKEQHYEK